MQLTGYYFLAALSYVLTVQRSSQNETLNLTRSK
jgi:hypothetical protein